MDMGTFFVVITVIYVVLLFAAIAVWAIESRLDVKKAQAAKENGGEPRAMRIEGDNEAIYLRVEGGTVAICEEPAAPAPAPVVEEAAPAAELVAEEEEEELAPLEKIFDAEEEDEDETADLINKYGELNDDSVVFQSQKNLRKTFIEKYAEMSAEYRGYYDEVVAYILAKPDCRKIEASTAVTFKCKADKLMRAVIKRDMAVLNFMLVNTELHRFVKESGVKNIKITPVVIRLESEDDVLLAKQTVDITLEHIREEQDYKKERRNERRRLNRKKKEEQAEDAE